jgi:hypothetical protein
MTDRHPKYLEHSPFSFFSLSFLDFFATPVLQRLPVIPDRQIDFDSVELAE